MMITATVRDLRNSFPKVRKLVEAQGEVIVTEKGAPKYRLTLYTPKHSSKATPQKDYMKRLTRHQPRSMTPAASKALDQENRGER
jgi:antitoxin (DNA-binding transcriptional repressor) of toxin-antitoxin stability system